MVMKPVLDKLHNDHINFSKLLSYLDKQLQMLEEGESCDLTSTLDAIKYMKEYPDYVHHPLENVVFKYFLEHYDESHEHILELLHEHDNMPLLTDKLIYMLEDALTDFLQSRKELCAHLKKYITIQKEHMNQEELHVYPILNSTLDEHDWEIIDSELVNVEDPLFSKKVEKSYQALLQRVLS